MDANASVTGQSDMANQWTCRQRRRQRQLEAEQWRAVMRSRQPAKRSISGRTRAAPHPIQCQGTERLAPCTQRQPSRYLRQ